MEKNSRKWTIPWNALVLFGCCCFFLAASLLIPDKDRSVRERRNLQAFPALSFGNVMDGEFQAKLDDYASDQIAWRDSLLGLSAWIDRNILLNLDVHGIISQDGHLISIFDEVDENSITYAASVFSRIYENYLMDTDCRIYFSIIPDKAFYLENPLIPTIDYEEFFNLVLEEVDFAEYVDLTSSLELEDYYYTDSHWKIENLRETADILAESMGVTIEGNEGFDEYSSQFLGVYASQSFESSADDTLLIPDQEFLSGLKLYEFSSGEKQETELISTQNPEDQYQIYLSGNNGLLELVNEKSPNHKELVIFRDSYASSLAFYLSKAYERIWLVDLRDFNSTLLSRFIQFDDQDVLFLYSTTVLNNAYTLR